MKLIEPLATAPSGSPPREMLPSSAYPVRRELRTLIYSAITESFA